MLTKTKIRVQKRKIYFENLISPYAIIANKKVRIPKLLTDGDTNAKLAKVKIQTRGLSLAPHELSGHQMCGMHTDGCAGGCLGEQGHGAISQNVMRSRIAKSMFFAQYPKLFCQQLERELFAFSESLDIGEIGGVRLNVFSDRPWERYLDLAAFSNLVFWDYTKFKDRAGRLDNNYYVTFSRSESNQDDAIEILRAKKGNVAVVFADMRNPFVGRYSSRQRLPKSWMGFPVVDGDITDYRPSDPQGGYVIGLRLKAHSYFNRDLTIKSGFAVPYWGSKC